MANERALFRTPLVVTTKSYFISSQFFFFPLPIPCIICNQPRYRTPSCTRPHLLESHSFSAHGIFPAIPPSATVSKALLLRSLFSSPSTVYTHPVHPSRHYQRAVSTFARCVSRATMCVASHCMSHMRADGAGSHSEAFFFSQKNIRSAPLRKVHVYPCVCLCTPCHTTPRASVRRV